MKPKSSFELWKDRTCYWLSRVDGDLNRQFGCFVLGLSIYSGNKHHKLWTSINYEMELSIIFFVEALKLSITITTHDHPYHWNKTWPSGPLRASHLVISSAFVKQWFNSVSISWNRSLNDITTLYLNKKIDHVLSFHYFSISIMSHILRLHFESSACTVLLRYVGIPRVLPHQEW